MTEADLFSQIAAHDPATLRHLHSVRDGCYRLARTMGLGEGAAEAVAHAGLLHDIGKIYIARWILRAPRKLQSFEMVVLRAHAEQGAELVRAIGYNDQRAEWVYSHHERLDKSGYPRGLGAEQIPLEVRILSVVDTWDAMTQNRRYAIRRTDQERKRELLREVQVGRLDRDVTAAWLSLVDCGVEQPSA